MRYYILLFLFPLNSTCSSDQDYLSEELILSNIQKVPDYELAHPSVHNYNIKYDFKNGWIPSTFYISLIPLYEATNESRYFDSVKSWGSSVDWECAPRFRHAVDIACGQVFWDLYRHDKNPVYIEKLMERLDSLMIDLKPGREDWWWCDAHFMAPPVYMMAGDIFNTQKYYEYADSMYWDVYKYLYDSEDSLFYRDAKYFEKLSPNGSKVFWGRGNGWVIGGLARMIPYIENSAMKEPYLKPWQKELQAYNKKTECGEAISWMQMTGLMKKLQVMVFLLML